MSTKINISADGTKPHATQKRRLGKRNIGLYCEACSEFFAVAVLPDGPTPPFEIVSDGIPLFECPMCRHQQRRQTSEIEQIVLTESNKRRPKPPSSLN